MTDRGYALANILFDLDRCEHGRHEGDICSGEKGCNGPSKGNPRIRTGDVIGYTMEGHCVVMPPREFRSLPESWVMRGKK